MADYSRKSFYVIVLLVLVFQPAIFADQVDDLVARLKDSELEVIQSAIIELGELKDTRAIEPLKEILNPNSTTVSVRNGDSATKAAEELKSDPPEIIDAKYRVAGGYTPKPYVRIDAKELRRYTSKLQKGSIIEKEQAIISLAKTNDDRAINYLVRSFLTDRFARNLQPQILEAIGTIGGEEAVQAFDKIILSSKFREKELIQVLSYLKEPAAANKLYDMLQESRLFSDDIIDALKRQGMYSAVFILNKIVKEGSVFDQRKAQEALDSFGPDHGLEPIIELLDSENQNIKIAAIEAIHKLEDPAVAFYVTDAIVDLPPQLQAKYNDGKPLPATATGNKTANANTVKKDRAGNTSEDENSASTATKSRFSGNSPASDLRERLAKISGRESRRGKTEQEVKPDAEPETKPDIPLEPVVEEPPLDWTDIKIAAIEALGKIGTTKTIRPLLNELQNTANEHNIRVSAGRALRMVESRSAYKAIEKKLYHQDRRIVQAAIESLGYLGDDSSLELLKKFVGSDRSYQDAAFKAISYSDNPRAAEILADLIIDSPRSFAGRNAIKQLDAKDLIPKVVDKYAELSYFEKKDIFSKALGYNNPDSTRILLMSIQEPALRRDAIKGLYVYKEVDSVKPLIDYLANADYWQAEEDVFNLLTKFCKKQEADLLVPLLRLGRDESSNIVTLLDRFNYQPKTNQEKLYYYMAKGDWDKLNALEKTDEDAVMKIYKLRYSDGPAIVLTAWGNKEIKDILHDRFVNWRISKKQRQLLFDNFSFSPKTDPELLAAAMYSGDSKQFEKAWNSSSSMKSLIRAKLVPDSGSSYIVINYVISGRIKELVSPVISCFNQMKQEDFHDISNKINMANQLLNSGNQQLINAAKSWAERNPDKVEITTFTTFSKPSTW